MRFDGTRNFHWLSLGTVNQLVLRTLHGSSIGFCSAVEWRRGCLGWLFFNPCWLDRDFTKTCTSILILVAVDHYAYCRMLLLPFVWFSTAMHHPLQPSPFTSHQPTINDHWPVPPIIISQYPWFIAIIINHCPPIPVTTNSSNHYVTSWRMNGSTSTIN